MKRIPVLLFILAVLVLTSSAWAAGEGGASACGGPCNEVGSISIRTPAVDPPFYFHNSSDCTVYIKIYRHKFGRNDYTAIEPHSPREIWLQQDQALVSVWNGWQWSGWIRVDARDHSEIKHCSPTSLFAMDWQEGNRRWLAR